MPSPAGQPSGRAGGHAGHPDPVAGGWLGEEPPDGVDRPVALHDALPISTLRDQPATPPSPVAVLRPLRQQEHDIIASAVAACGGNIARAAARSEEHTAELQSRETLVCRPLRASRPGEPEGMPGTPIPSLAGGSARSRPTASTAPLPYTTLSRSRRCATSRPRRHRRLPY